MVQGAELEGVNLESRSTSVPLCTVKLRLRTGLPRSNLLFSQLHTLQGRSCLYLFFCIVLAAASGLPVFTGSGGCWGLFLVGLEVVIGFLVGGGDGCGVVALPGGVSMQHLIDGEGQATSSRTW